MRAGNVPALARGRSVPDTRGRHAPGLLSRTRSRACHRRRRRRARRAAMAETCRTARVSGPSPRKSRTREHLISLLWSDRDERQARHSLSEALRVLRRALGNERLVADVDQVRLAPDAVTLDCDRFAELCERREWANAAELVDGEFLEGLAIPEANDFENWLAAERALWRAQALEALVQGVAADLARGDAAAAARVGLRAVALDPTSEPAARAAIRALTLAGDRGAALRVADELVRALHDMLGAEVSEEHTSELQSLTDISY